MFRVFLQLQSGRSDRVSVQNYRKSQGSRTILYLSSEQQQWRGNRRVLRQVSVEVVKRQLQIRAT